MAKGGLKAKTFKGLNKRRMASRSGGGGSGIMRVKVQDDKVNTVQFRATPDEFEEIEQHGWQQDGKWMFVPCVGEGCPLCASEDDKVRKTSYRFIAPVYDFATKEQRVLEGPATMASLIFRRFEAAPSKFKKRVWELTRFSGTPTTFDMTQSEETPINPARMKEPADVHKYIQGAVDWYYENAGADVSSLDDSFDDDGEWEEDEDWADEAEEPEGYSEDDLLAMGPSALQEAAAEVNIKVSKVTKENRKKLIAAILKRQ